MIDTTLGIENVTWYAKDQRDIRRISIVFQDALRTEHRGDDKVPGEIEFWGDSPTVPYSRMEIESPEDLDDLARAIKVAAQHWRHCIEECPCFQDEAEDEPGVQIISLGGFDLPGLWEPREDEEEDSER